MRIKLKKTKNKHAIKMKKMGNTVKGYSKEELETYKGRKGKKRKIVDDDVRDKEIEEEKAYDE